MSLREFAAAALATRSPLKRDFTFGGKTITGYFLDLPALEVREMLKVEGPDRDAAFVASVVCDESGANLFTLEQARLLKTQHLNVMITEAFSALGLTSDGRAEAKKP